MWKVLIADDEPKIRQGLKNALETFGLPIQVCGEAKNGVEALKKAEETRPDILLVDICMPKLSGIQFLQEVKKLELDCKMIIISGFNEFSYAQQAISLGVSSYLLKPIPEEELKAELESVMKGLENERKDRKYHALMKQQINKNSPYLRDTFFQNWLDGKLDEAEQRVQREFLDIRLSEEVTMLLLSVRTDLEGSTIDGTQQEELYKSVMERSVREVAGDDRSLYVFMGRSQDVTGILEGYSTNTDKLRQELSQDTDRIAEGKYYIQVKNCRREDIPAIYEEMEASARRIMECRPIVAQARQYIYAHYAERDLDLTQVAANIGCNPSYLSRTMKQELGISFKDYLTMLRIRQAKNLMRDRGLSLNQIAEKVGYSNQHYFSAAFKNCQGVSPSEYRRSVERPVGCE
ncbi:response regulator [Ruminococcus sp. 5_1_39BFAA]|uniref:response regulator transcription factor n=1 Tax=Ruminococcus sp. 5_1_39BFAA TaxID=457412 RepID=UPI00356B4641